METTAGKHACTQKPTLQTMPLHHLLGFCKKQKIGGHAEKALLKKA